MNNLDFTVYMYNKRMYSKCPEAELLKLVQSEIDPEISAIPPLWIDLFDYFLNTEPCNLYNREIQNLAYNKLCDLYKLEPDEFNRGVILGLQYVFQAIRSYLELSDILREVEPIDEEPEIKTRLYRIPAYAQIIESVMSNLFRFLREIIGCVNGKDYSNQNNLGNLKNILESNGLYDMFQFIDIDVRNSINHGGVIISPYDIKFIYTSGKSRHNKEWTIRDKFGETAYALAKAGKPHFDDFIEGVFDDAGGLIIGIISFFSKHTEVIIKNIDNIGKDWFLLTEYMCRFLSYPECICTHIDTGLVGSSQLNLNFFVSESDHGKLAQHALEVAIISSNWIPNYQRYLVHYRHLRMPSGYIRFNKEELDDVVNNQILPEDLMKQVISRGDFLLLFKANDEEINLEIVKMFRYPLIGEDKWILREINDVSNLNNKRFLANLYIPTIKDREKIIGIIESVINKLKYEENPPSPKMKIKHGKIPADAIYLKVFKKQLRRKYRSIVPSNSNFICFAEWHSDDCPPLKHGGLPEEIWRELDTNKHDNLSISWNPTIS